MDFLHPNQSEGQAGWSGQEWSEEPWGTYGIQEAPLRRTKVQNRFEELRSDDEEGEEEFDIPDYAEFPTAEELTSRLFSLVMTGVLSVILFMVAIASQI